MQKLCLVTRCCHIQGRSGGPQVLNPASAHNKHVAQPLAPPNATAHCRLQTTVLDLAGLGQLRHLQDSSPPAKEVPQAWATATKAVATSRYFIVPALSKSQTARIARQKTTSSHVPRGRPEPAPAKPQKERVAGQQKQLPDTSRGPSALAAGIGPPIVLGLGWCPWPAGHRQLIVGLLHFTVSVDHFTAGADTRQ